MADRTHLVHWQTLALLLKRLAPGKLTVGCVLLHVGGKAAAVVSIFRVCAMHVLVSSVSPRQPSFTSFQVFLETLNSLKTTERLPLGIQVCFLYDATKLGDETVGKCLTLSSHYLRWRYAAESG